MSENILPQETVSSLDKYIVGQDKAKKSVAIALRNRVRRMQLPKELREEITPKNILMIGPTGVGKTEIARRLAKLANAPFIKIEATKFTEVGYVGRDVESIIRDLAHIAVKQTLSQATEKVKEKAQENAEEKILDLLLPGSGTDKAHETEDAKATRQIFRKKFREGELDEKEIELEIANKAIGVEIMAPPGMEEMTNQLQGLFQNMSGDKKKMRKMQVKKAFKLLTEEESQKLINEEELKNEAIRLVEQNGIVFLDEIDKVTQRSDRNGGDVSREGVQRDLLPLIEGCSVVTKYGTIKTDHILFIASGAFHLAKPSDLIPELQGRLPIRVELDALKAEDFVRILTEPNASLTKQYDALLSTEDVKLDFTKDGIDRIANLACHINERNENIGARRLHTVMEKLLEDVSFNASSLKGTTVTIDEKYVDQQIGELCEDEDLSKFIL